MRAIDHLLSRNLADVRGTHIVGTLPVREDVLNTALTRQLASRRGRIQQMEIRIRDNNRLEVAVRVAVGPFARWFRPELILNEQAIWSQSPMVIITFASAQYGAFISLIEPFAKELLPGGFYVKGRQIAIDFAGIPQAAKYRSHFQHLKELKLRTVAGKLSISFEVRVD